jgi:hypothetical protein
MASIIRGVWVASAAGTGDLSADDVASLRAIEGVNRAAVYEVIPRTPEEKEKSQTRVDHLDEVPGPQPTALILTEWDSLRPCVHAEEALRKLPVEREGAGRSVVNRSVFARVSSVFGQHDADYPDFGPNIQLGQFNMPTQDAEFELSVWYEDHRLEPFSHLDGVIRASRLASIVGPTKFGVLYELISREAHLAFIANLEERAHDPNDEMGRVVRRTIHSWLSPAFAQRVL